MQKSERQLRREVPLPEIALPSDAKQEESLAATQPHVAPAPEQKAKPTRTKSARALKRNRDAKEKGMERSQKLAKRKDSVDTKKSLKKRAKQLWE